MNGPYPSNLSTLLALLPETRLLRLLPGACLGMGLGILMWMWSATSAAFELFEEDNAGNINQRSIGVLQSKSLHSGSAGNFILEKQTRALPPFTRIALNTAAQLSYRESGPTRLEIEASESSLRALNVAVKAGVLEIEGNGLQIDTAPLIKVFGRDLEGLSLNSAASVTMRDIQATRFDLQITGATEITITGKATNCEFNIQGASDADLANLKCVHAKLRSFGSNDIRLTAEQSISGHVQGAGDIEVLGRPAVRQLQVNGASELSYP